MSGAAVAEWLSSWLAEQEGRGSIPGHATWIFRDWLSPASKSRYGWKIAKSTLILETTNQPIFPHVSRSLLCIRFVAVEEEDSWRRGPPVTYFCPALDPPLGGSGRKTTTLVRDHEYFIPTKFHQNPSSGSGEEVENVKVYRRTDDGRTNDGRCAMTIAHLSLWLRWAKNWQNPVV